MEESVQTAPIFSDNMVLQHGKPIPVWGTGKPGTTVTISWKNGNDTLVRSVKVRNGAWRILLPPLNAETQGALIITDGTKEIRFHNVAAGDVWFAGGQSNMELELQHCLNGNAELEKCGNPDIRFYQTVKRAFVDQAYLQEEAQNCWRVCSPDTAASLSAAAYFFARNINVTLNIPIGIINCSWGGTSISAWMSEIQLSRSFAGQRYLDDYRTLAGNKTDEQYDTEMEAYFAEWNAWDARIQAWREKEPDASWEILNKNCGICPWPQPVGRKSPYRPANLYHAMVKRVAPYGLKGFLYYQGEEDHLRAGDYYEMMYYLIDQWRCDWEDDSLPFLFVQLPMYVSCEEAAAGQPDKNWCIIRENQYRASVSIAHTGMAVIIDCGEYDNIHPLDKQTVGYRLALQALKKVYHKTIESEGPIFLWSEPEENTLRLHFDHAETGLESRGPLEGFEVAGPDRRYYPAQAYIDGSDVVVLSDQVSEPQQVRYAWIKFGPTPLYAKNGLPAMPFRSCRKEEL